MPADPRDFTLDLSTGPRGGAPAPAARPFLSVLFKCCGAYARVHKSRDGLAYAGHCPKCARPVRFPVGPGGTTARTFIAE